MDERQEWDQQPGEPMRWYERFELYRLLGPGRSLLGAVKAEAEQKRAKKSNSVSQSWADAAKGWRWRERAEAWDQAEMERSRAAQEAAYRERLETHRVRALEVSTKAMDGALRMLEKVTDRLIDLGIDEIPAKSLPAFLRASGAVADVALNAEAQALSVEQLLQELDANGLDHGA